MKQVLSTEKRPVKLWLDDMEAGALAQARNLANHPFTFRHVAIMPDAHEGYGMPIGGVLACDGAVIPNAVGVDIGCGVCAAQTALPGLDRETLKKILGLIRSAVPVGFDHHKRQQDRNLMPDPARLDGVEKSIVRQQFEAGCKQIGTLGGGNHFIEVDRDDAGNLYLVVHSGSRHLGKQIAEYYQRLAGRDKPDKALAYLEGKPLEDYLHDMRIAQQYAALNRQAIAETILAEAGLVSVGQFTTVHNYIDLESMILRKGAVSARQGERLLIPMNMRDGSIIAIGRGNREWNYSAPHGAGRLMSRRKAFKTLSMTEFRDSMTGVYTTTLTPDTLDEAPAAYKPMAEILQYIRDTVDVVEVIRPVYNFKAAED